VLGVDLAAQPKKSSAAILDGGRVIELVSGVDDDMIVRWAETCELVGLDAPLGWPDPFVSVVTAHHAGMALPPAGARDLQLRHTDQVIANAIAKQPLSVSTDRIGVVALRAIRLLERLAGPGADRSGGAGIYETYPGGAVAQWSLTSGSYKRVDGTTQRLRIVEELTKWIDLNGFGDQMVECDDDLDAVLCGVIARLAAAGRTIRPTPAETDRARREGWIHVPAGEIADLSLLGS